MRTLDLQSKRMNHLRDDYERLLNLQAQSDLVHVQTLNQRPGWPPEKYLITFAVKGISGINQDKTPIYSEFHQVEMTIPPEYPAKQPGLMWKTPIWHPNISHNEPRHVCTDEANSFYPAKRLDQLVEYLARMAQYQVYHAQMEPPYPWDTDVAAWVRDIAEPKGWIGPKKPVDPRSIYRRIDVEFGPTSVATERDLNSKESSTEPFDFSLGELVAADSVDVLDIQLGTLDPNSTSE